MAGINESRLFVSALVYQSFGELMLYQLITKIYPLHLKMRTWVNAESENYQ